MTSRLSFGYAGVRADGEVCTGSVRATSSDEASALLRGQGIWATRLQRRREFRLRSSISPAHHAEALESLASLLGAGIALPRALEILAELVDSAWQQALPGLRTDVARGLQLSDALAETELDLADQVVGIVRAGEEAGRLGDGLHHAAEALAFRADTGQELRDALTYPAILLVAGGATISFLVLSVLPQFAALLLESGATLPRATRWMLAGGAFTRVFAMPVLVATAAGLLGLAMWTRTEGGRVRWHRLLRRVPWLGPIRESMSTAVFCQSLAGLLSSGSSLSDAMGAARATVSDEAARESLDRADRLLAGGASLRGALDESGGASRLATRLIGVGEETGDLAAMLRHAAIVERRQLRRRVKAAVRFVEPALILLFGLIVAVIAASLLQALYSFNVTAQP